MAHLGPCRLRRRPTQFLGYQHWGVTQMPPSLPSFLPHKMKIFEKLKKKLNKKAPEIMFLKN